MIIKWSYTVAVKNCSYATNFISYPMETSKAKWQLAYSSTSSLDESSWHQPSLTWKVITSWYLGVIDMGDKQSVIKNIYHPDMTDAGHEQLQWS